MASRKSKRLRRLGLHIERLERRDLLSAIGLTDDLPDLSLRIDQNLQRLQTGGTFSRLITLENTSDVDLQEVSVEVDFGDRVQNLKWAVDATPLAPQLGATLVNVPAGEFLTLAVDGVIANGASGAIESTVVVSAGEHQITARRTETATPTVDLKVQFTGYDTEVVPFEQTTYEFQVTNEGTETATNVNLAHTFDDSLLNATWERTVSFDLSELSPESGVEYVSEIEGERLGWQLSDLGDINGDGYDDVAFGSHHRFSPRLAYVIYGNAGGLPNIGLADLDGTNGFTISDALNIGPAGDVNMDGIDDFVVVGLNGPGFSGHAFVVFGKTTGYGASLDLNNLGGSDGFQVREDEPILGVSRAGDINSDGIDDLAIASDAFFEGSTGIKKVFFVFGRASEFPSLVDLSNLSSSDGFVVTGNENSFFGYSVRALGDVNGDAIDDVIIGAAVVRSPSGADVAGAYVVYGSDQGFAPEINVSDFDGTNHGLFIYGPERGQLLGQNLDGVGDFNADGINDFAIGVKTADPGKVYVVFGRSSNFSGDVDLELLDGSTGVQVIGSAVGDGLGFSVASAGDFNGDGVADVITSADSEGDGGVAYVLFGSSDNHNSPLTLGEPNSRVLRIEANTATEDIRNVRSAGDVNGDGFDDVVIGSHEVTQQYGGYANVFVFYGRHLEFGSSPPSLIPMAAGVTLSYVVGGLVKGTLETQYSTTVTLSTSDQVDAEPTNNSDQVTQAVLPRSVDLDVRWLEPETAFSPGSEFERTLEIRNPGDFEALDTLVEVQFDSKLEDVAWTRSVSGPLTGYSSDLETSVAEHGQSFYGTEENLRAGNGVALLENFDGDHLSDVAISVGDSVSVVYGTDEIQRSNEVTLPIAAGDRGFSINGLRRSKEAPVRDAGDFNNDGISDLLLPGFNEFEESEVVNDAVYVVYGTQAKRAYDLNANNLDASEGLRIGGSPNPNEYFRTLAGLGDVNGDGIDDIAISAYTVTDGEDDKIYVLFGTSEGLPTDFDVTLINGENGFEIRAPYASFLYRPAHYQLSAGDLNSDGVNDLVFSSHRDIVIVFGRSQFDQVFDPWDATQDGVLFVIGENHSHHSVFNAGDINGDKIDDFAFLSWDQSTRTNKLFALFGSETEFNHSIHVSELNGAIGRTVEIEESFRVGAAGDINDDGINDILLASLAFDHTLAVIFGTNKKFDNPVPRSSLGDGGTFHWGSFVLSPGRNTIDAGHDVNGDGVSDVLFGYSSHSAFGDHLSGSAFVIFGQPRPPDVVGNGDILDSVDIAVGSTVRYVVRGKVAGDASGQIQVSATATPAEFHADTDLDNNSSVLTESIFNAPEVLSISVNDGLAQRSTVTSVAITFDSLVDPLALESAFEVRNVSTDESAGVVNVSAIDDGQKTTAVLSFTGLSTVGGSLVDGNYRLKILSSQVLANSVPLDGDSNGVAGGDYLFGSVETDDFFRFFGDGDGDRDVDLEDFGGFGLTFRRRDGDPAFDSRFDTDLDGDVDLEDFGQFGLRFRETLDF